MSELFPDGLEEEALQRVASALQSELEIGQDEAKSRAESLIAVAVSENVAIVPELLQWIHFRAPEKEWSVAEWRRWCEKYTRDRKALAAFAASSFPFERGLMCSSCLAFAMKRTQGGEWICQNCGYGGEPTEVL